VERNESVWQVLAPTTDLERDSVTGVVTWESVGKHMETVGNGADVVGMSYDEQPASCSSSARENRNIAQEARSVSNVGFSRWFVSHLGRKTVSCVMFLTEK
jgi:hypothetical protein